MAELAATVADVAGAPVAYRAVDSAALGPAAFVHDLIAEGLFREPSDDLEKLLGRSPPRCGTPWPRCWITSADTA